MLGCEINKDTQIYPNRTLLQRSVRDAKLDAQSRGFHFCRETQPFYTRPRFPRSLKNAFLLLFVRAYLKVKRRRNPRAENRTPLQFSVPSPLKRSQRILISVDIRRPVMSFRPNETIRQAYARSRTCYWKLYIWNVNHQRARGAGRFVSQNWKRGILRRAHLRHLPPTCNFRAK